MSSGSLDDVLDRLRDFSSLLGETNNDLRLSHKKMVDALAELDAHWHDKTRHEHDQFTNELFQSLERVLHYDLPEMRDFLDGRISKLEEYFEL